MKSFVLAIALLFLTGTQARFPWQHEEPERPLQHYREWIESYLHKVQEVGKDAATQAESSELAKQLDLKIRERFDAFSANALAWRKQLHPYVDKVREEVSAELEKDIPLLKEKIRPYIETFHNNWGAKVKAFKENIAPLVDQLKQQTRDNVEEFYKKVQPQLEDLREKLRSDYDTLRTNIDPYKHDLKQKLIERFEEVKANAGPKAEEFRAQFAQNVENLKQRLGPVIENLKEQLLPKVEEAKVKLAELWETLKAKAAERHAQT